MFNPIPDGYLVDELIVFGGPAGGQVAKGFWIEVPDLQAASFADRNQAQDAFSAILRQLPEGWSLQIREFQDNGCAQRLLEYQRLTESCGNPTAQMLRNTNFVREWQRLEKGELRHKRVTLYVGRPLAAQKVLPWSRQPAEQHYAKVLAEARTAFLEWQQILNQILQPIGGRAVAMTDADQARVWADALNPSFSERVHYDPAVSFDVNHSILDNCWHSELRGQGRQGFVLDGYHHLAFSLKRLPTETFPTIIHRLTDLPFGGVTITTHVRRLTKEKVLKRTEAAINRINQQLAGKPSERLEVAKAQLEEKIRRISNGEVVPMEMELIVMLKAKTAEELSAKAAATKAAFQSMNGAQYYEATLPASSRNLFAASLPAAMWTRHRGFTHYGEDRYVADLLPFCGSFAGHPGPMEAMFQGADANLVNILTFLAGTPQNLILLGQTGGGKSLALLKLLLETASFFGFTAIIEEGFSQSPYTRSFGIEPIMFRLDGTQTINPFDTHGSPLSSFVRATLTALIARMVGLPADEDKARRQSALIARHVSQLCADHAQDQLRQWSEERRSALIRHALALTRWASEHGVSDTEAFVDFRELQREQPARAAALLAQFTESELCEFESAESQKLGDLVFAYLSPDEHLTLSSLREYLLLAQEDLDECRWLATLLTPWCRGGNCANLFDGVSNVSLTGPVVHFELGLIPEAAKEIKAVAGFLIISSIRHHILSLPRLMKKRVVIDEVSRFLDVPGGEAILRELNEQFRKFSCLLVVSAQQYTRIADTRIRAALVGNTRAWMLFNTGDRQDVERLGQDLGLSRVAVEAILRFPRPDQQTGAKYSEFLYWHSDVRQPICGIARYVLLPHELPSSPALSATKNKT